MYCRPQAWSGKGNGTDLCEGHDYIGDYDYMVPCPWDCSKYYVCEVGMVAIEMDCATPLHFDPSLGKFINIKSKSLYAFLIT